MTMRIGSLFSGIGGLELGLERAGVGRVAWQVEKDPYCRTVLAKHWPDAQRFDDVVSLIPPDADVICGGFPCQDISTAGRMEGIDGQRSGLWREFARIIGVVRPRYVVVENVAGLAVRGLDRVLGDFASIRYDAEWDCISAASVGAPHERDRMFILAYPAGFGHSEPRHDRGRGVDTSEAARWETTHAVDALARGAVPVVCREHDGVPNRMDRLRGLGNAVVPACAAKVGRRIMDIELKRAA